MDLHYKIAETFNRVTGHQPAAAQTGEQLSARCVCGGGRCERLVVTDKAAASRRKLKRANDKMGYTLAI